MAFSEYCVLVPLALAAIYPATFIGTYLSASLHGHLTPGLTLISDAASQPPQSCFFAQLLNIAAALTAICVYIRYVELQCRQPPQIPPPEWLQTTFLISGWLAALGVSMVGCFQFDHAPIMHGLGALFCFGVGTVSVWTQVLCTKFDPPDHHSRLLLCLRSALALLCSVFFGLTIAGSVVAWIHRGGPKTTSNYHVGYEWFLLGSGSEWAMAFSMAAFIATFSREARYYDIKPPSVTVNLSPASIGILLFTYVSEVAYFYGPGVKRNITAVLNLDKQVSDLFLK